MLSQDRKKLAQLEVSDVNELADFLCHSSPAVRPIFECIKVYAKIHESGKFTYARHPFDLGTGIISASEISTRMNCENRQSIVNQALCELESIKTWPFAPGSSSWILLEILHPDIRITGGTNKPTIIFRRAVRLNSRGDASSTPMLEKIFSRLDESSLNELSQQSEFQFIIDPTLHLRNISGTGVYTKFTDELDGIAYLTEGKKTLGFTNLQSYYTDVVNDFIEELFENNFDILNENNPGVYFSFMEEEYILRPQSFDIKKKMLLRKKNKTTLPPLPTLGMIK